MSRNRTRRAASHLPGNRGRGLTVHADHTGPATRRRRALSETGDGILPLWVTPTAQTRRCTHHGGRPWQGPGVAATAHRDRAAVRLQRSGNTRDTTAEGNGTAAAAWSRAEPCQPTDGPTRHAETAVRVAPGTHRAGAQTPRARGLPAGTRGRQRPTPRARHQECPVRNAGERIPANTGRRTLSEIGNPPHCQPGQHACS